MNDLDTTKRIGERVRALEKGDQVRVTNDYIDHDVIGEVVEKTDEPNGEEWYHAIVEDFDGDRWELHANWRDIPPESDDQTTPYTGLAEAPWDDTAPPITDLEVNP